MTNLESEQIFRYHAETKHSYHRYARSPGYLDWETQPNPFRFYEGVTPLLLPLLKKDPEGGHLDLYEHFRNQFWDFNLPHVAAFLELSLGLSAWKSIPGGPPWSLRINPSSGDLHPTEAHLLLPPLLGPSRLQVQGGAPEAALQVESGLHAGVYHYNPYLHALEPRALLPEDFWRRIRSHFQSSGFLIGLTSIVWRESWKYGERALRYCHHDVGHALAALSFSGNLLGWKITFLNALSDEDVAQTLGLQQVVWPKEESEHPDLLCFVSPASVKAVSRGLPPDLLKAFRGLSFQGQPNRLSHDHVEWSLIDETFPNLEKPRTPEASVRLESSPLVRHPLSPLPAAQLIRKRRSAIAFDGLTSLAKSQFLAILDKTLPRHGLAPFDTEVGPPRVHLLLFVHRVRGLAEGLYFYLRRKEMLDELKRTFGRNLAWSPVEEDHPLFLLKEGDFRSVATQVSCQQEIAGKGAFSLGMIAQFRSALQYSPWIYKHLFWETGMIGQVLYLEAEAHGLRGTGIGCFFDDPVHEILGLQNDSYQSLYHFTIGGPLEDSRLHTDPPYSHLPADRR